MSLRARIATTSVQDAQAAVDNAACEHDQALRRLAEVKANAAREALQSVLADWQTVLRSGHTREDLAEVYDRFIEARDAYLDAWLDVERYRPADAPVRIEVRS